MSKKEVLVVTLLVCGLAVACAGGYVAWRYFQDEKSSQSLAPMESSEASSIPGTTSQSATSAGGLAVSSNNLGQLSGQPNTAGSSNNEPSASSTDPTSFKEYEQYKDATSGLFGDVKVGTGSEVKGGSKVALYYKGWLTNGTLFDQSRKGEDGSLQPFMFTIGAQEVIPGMEQGLVGMKVGGTRRLIIPPSVGYGEQGQGEAIPPNSVLVFDVQLLAVQ